MQEHIPGSSHCLPMNTSSMLGAGVGWGGGGGGAQQGLLLLPRRGGGPLGHMVMKCVCQGWAQISSPTWLPLGWLKPQGQSDHPTPRPWGNILYFDFFHQHFIVFHLPVNYNLNIYIYIYLFTWLHQVPVAAPGIFHCGHRLFVALPEL